MITGKELVDFYLKQWKPVENLEKQLKEEIKRYEESYKEGEMGHFVFKLHKQITLEKLPLLLALLNNRPAFSIRWMMYEKKDKVEALKKIEEFLKSLGIKPLPRTPEIKEWAKDRER
ncbi:MAG: hypothetical protein V1804_04495 [Patescibacteria group bacterium]